MEAMASKYTAKKIMEEAGVPTIKDILEYQSEEWDYVKNKIGFPILAKAALGGGGKGVKLIKNEDLFFD